MNEEFKVGETVRFLVEVEAEIIEINKDSHVATVFLRKRIPYEMGVHIDYLKKPEKQNE